MVKLEESLYVQERKALTLRNKIYFVIPVQVMMRHARANIDKPIICG